MVVAVHLNLQEAINSSVQNADPQKQAGLGFHLLAMNAPVVIVVILGPKNNYSQNYRELFLN